MRHHLYTVHMHELITTLRIHAPALGKRIQTRLRPTAVAPLATNRISDLPALILWNRAGYEQGSGVDAKDFGSGRKLGERREPCSRVIAHHVLG